MRSRDEVLREFGANVPPAQVVAMTTALRMADRLRELEARQVASEPVAWALYEGETMLHATTKQSTRNSWQKDVDRGPRMVPLRIVPLYAHPSAATVTEAMVEAAAKVGCDNGFDRDFDAPGMYWDAMHKVVTAALQTAASEGASDA